MKIFIVDNYDSFTFNLVHILEQYSTLVTVKRNDQIRIKDIEQYDKIVFSPGPGLPSEVDIMHTIIDSYKDSKPILGVCLGHQSIAEYFGATLLNMPEVNHGREFDTKVVNEDYIYKDIPKTFKSGRYHSWVVDDTNLPKDFIITSIDAENNQIMSIKHTEFDIRGVQFHPESIMTIYGAKMLENWVNFLNDKRSK